MKSLINTIRNIFAIEDLRVRILNTLGFLLVYRIGSYIVLPGVDAGALAAAHSSDQGGLVGLINIFAGGAFSRAAIFGLGIMPYISASIVMQLMGIAVPYFQKLQKEGTSGQKKIERYTRVLTVIVTAFQAPGYIASQIGAYIPHLTPFFYIRSTIILVAGTVFVMWLGEKITDKGIGNGISLIIMIGILARLPFAFSAELFGNRMKAEGGGLIVFLVEIVFLVLVVMATILLVQGTRKIPVQFAKRIVGNKQYGGARQFIPLKVNAAGVMPIIFAQAIMFLPLTVFTSLSGNSTTMSGLVATFSNVGGFWYNFTFGLMIVAFTYFYTAVVINSNQMAEEMKRNGGFVPGIKPGRKTAEYIDAVMSRITLPGSIFLALVAIMPAVAMQFKVDNQFSRFYGGTSLLILVGVMMDTLQQVESYLLMRHYDGLMKTGRIKGRASLSGAAA